MIYRILPQITKSSETLRYPKYFRLIGGLYFHNYTFQKIFTFPVNQLKAFLAILTLWNN